MFSPRSARMTAAERRLTRAAPGPSDGFTSESATARGLRLHIRQHIDPDPAAPAAPILVLRGEFDPIAPGGGTTRAAELARSGRSGVIPGAAHNAVTTAGTAVAARAMQPR